MFQETGILLVNNILAMRHADKLDISLQYLQKRGFPASIDLVKFIPLIDSFASRLSTKLPENVSWSFDPHVSKVNAFPFHWPNIMFRGFLP